MKNLNVFNPDLSIKMIPVRDYTYVESGLKIEKISNTSFKINAGVAYFIIKNVSTKITFVEQVLPVPTMLSTISVTYLYLNTSGVIEYKNRAPLLEDLDVSIPIGAISSTDAGLTISQVFSFIIDSSPSSKTLMMLGILNISEIGLIPIANTLTFQTPAGKINSAGRNYFNDIDMPHVSTVPAKNPIQVTYISSTNQIIKKVTNFDFTIYDSLGSILAVEAGKATAQYVFMSAAGDIAVQPGQKKRSGLSNLLQYFNSDSFQKASILGGFTKIATILALGETTNVANISQCRIVNTNKFGANSEINISI